MSLPPPPPGGNPPPGPPPFQQAPVPAPPFQAPGGAPQPYTPNPFPVAGPYPPNYPYNVPYQPQQGWQQASPSNQRRVRKPVAIATIIAAAVAVVGSVLPWATLDSEFGSFSQKGLDADGKLTIVLALVIGGLFVVAATNGAVWPAITGIPVFALIAIIGAIDVADVNDQGDSFADVTGFDFQVGIGLWLVLLAGIAGTILSIIALTTRSQPVT